MTINTTEGTQQAAPQDRSHQEFPSVPHADVFEWHGEHAYVVLGKDAAARVSTAMLSIRTLAAILQQRDVDAECDGAGRLVFDSSVSVGLTSAIGVCAAFVADIIDGPDRFGVIHASEGGGDAALIRGVVGAIRSNQWARRPADRG